MQQIKIHILTDQPTGVPYLYATTTDMKTGRCPLRRQDLLTLYTNITHRLTGKRQRFVNIGKTGDIDIVKRERQYILRIKSQNIGIPIEKHDILSLYDEIGRILTEFDERPTSCGSQNLATNLAMLPHHQPQQLELF